MYDRRTQHDAKAARIRAAKLAREAGEPLTRAPSVARSATCGLPHCPMLRTDPRLKHGGRPVKAPKRYAPGMAGIRWDVLNGKITIDEILAMSTSQIMNTYRLTSRRTASQTKVRLRLYGIGQPPKRVQSRLALAAGELVASIMGGQMGESGSTANASR